MFLISSLCKVCSGCFSQVLFYLENKKVVVGWVRQVVIFRQQWFCGNWLELTQFWFSEARVQLIEKQMEENRRHQLFSSNCGNRRLQHDWWLELFDQGVSENYKFTMQVLKSYLRLPCRGEVSVTTMIHTYFWM